MSFANPIPVLDVNAIACVLVALGIVTIWYGRSLDVAASGGMAGSVSDRRFDPLADAGQWITSKATGVRSLLAVMWQAVWSAVVGAERRSATATAVACSHTGGSVGAVDIASRLTLDEQVQALQSRILGHVDSTRSSERLHLAASRQLDAADYALERLRADVDLISTARRASAAPLFRPLPRIAVLRRPLSPVAEAA